MLNRIYFTFLIAVPILFQSCAGEPSKESIYTDQSFKNDTSITYNESDYGCTDSTSFEYDSTAIIDDGSCKFHYQDLYFSNDRNTAYSDSARTKLITGLITDNTKGISKVSIRVLNGESIDDESLSDWLDQPPPHEVLYSMVKGFILLILIVVGLIVLIVLIKWILRKYNSSRKN